MTIEEYISKHVREEVTSIVDYLLKTDWEGIDWNDDIKAPNAVNSWFLVTPHLAYMLGGKGQLVISTCDAQYMWGSELYYSSELKDCEILQEIYGETN